MTVFLLIISFIIDGLLIFGIMTLSTRLKKSEELELRQEQVAREIEDLFSSYLMEIKEENNRMSQLIKQKNSSNNIQKEPIYSQINKNESDNQNHQVNQPYLNKASELSSGKKSVKEYSPPEPEKDQADYQPSLHFQVFSLVDRGYSIEEIARKLDKGKTEIELIVKFQQKNNPTT